MLSSNDLNKFYDISDFKNILKEKLPQKKFLKILNKSDYNKQIITLQSELVLLQNWIKENNKRVCIIFEGRDAAGKGGAIKRFVEHLNPRNSRVVALSKPGELELGQWYFQRYLSNIPNPGEIVFFDRSWYNRAIVEPVMGFCSNDEYLLFINQVNDFEKMLIDDGIIIIKLWFSISKEVQKSRFVSRLTNPLKTWKFSNVDLEGQKRWDLYSKYKTKMFDKTNTDIAPWKIIDSNNKLSARIESIKYVLSIWDFKNKNSTLKDNKLSLSRQDFIQIDNKQLKILNKSKSLINLLSRKNTSISKTIRYIKYERELKKLQVEMIRLQNWVFNENKKVIIICEGRDAAGKGGAIRRAIQHLNPRKFRVVALPKPNELERSQWYFQRYIHHFPKNGEIVFFDRSWYNRAVVEPVNGFCTQTEYKTFMNHINSFEKMIIDNNIILLKFYYSISKDVQLKRFNEIKNSPLKKWKYTIVDSNAQKLWSKYSFYKDLMFKKTNHAFAKWNIIKADKKIYARVKTLELILKNIPYDKKTKIHSEEINF